MKPGKGAAGGGLGGEGVRLKQRFLAQLPARGLEGLFDFLPDVYYFVKDRLGRFMVFNHALIELSGAKDESEVLGKTDAAFFPPDLAENYMRDDADVMAKGQPLVDRIELVKKPDGTISWYTTTKMPVLGRKGEVIGVAGFTRDLKKMNSTNDRFMSMAPVVELIMNDYAKSLTVAQLAAQAKLSVSQLERQFKKRFHVTPLKYIMKVRIDAACQMLAETPDTLAEIARQTGFYDQSHFTHQFQRHKGITPSQYRRDFRPGPQRT